MEIEPEGARFAVKFHTSKGEQLVLAGVRKSQPRLFGTIDSAVKVLHKIGVRRIVLDQLDQRHPEQASAERRTRPDRAEALNRAAEYDRWVLAKVQASRDDTRPPVSHEEWQKVRAEKLAQREAAKPA